MDLNWSLIGSTPDVGQRFLEGMQQGRSLAKQQAQDAALSALGKNPDDIAAQNALVPLNPDLALRFQQASSSRSQQAREKQFREVAGNVVRAHLNPLGSVSPSALAVSGAAPNNPLAARPAPAVADTGTPPPVDGSLAGSPAYQQAAAAPSAASTAPTPPSPGNLAPDHPVTQAIGNAVSTGQMDEASAWEAAYRADPASADRLIASISSLDKLTRDKIAQASDAMGSMAMTLKSLPQEQRAPYLQQHAGDLMAHGVTQQQLAAADLSDAGLNGYIGQAVGTKGLLEQTNKDRELTETGRHNVASETLTGSSQAETARHNQATEQSEHYKTFTGADGNTYIMNTDTGQIVDGSGSSSGDGAAPSGSARSVRNSNPGNLIASGWTQRQPGYKGKDSAGYAIFDTPEHGAAAQAALLTSYMANGRNTVSSIIEKWAPRASKGGDNTEAQTSNYAAYVAKQLGVGVNDKLTPASAGRLAQAMAQFESGATGKAGATRVGSTGGGPKPAITAASGGSGVAGLSPAALDQAARVYNMTGQIPTALGRNGIAQRAILTRAAELASGQDTGSIVGDRASRKADTSALAHLQTTSANVLAFERTAQMNGRLAVELSAKANVGGVPLFNRWVNAGRRNTGDPDIAAFHAAVETFANEYARITASATGGGVTSDSAREHVHQMINDAQSPAQFHAVMSTLYRDMENRRRGLEQERQQLLGRISGHGPNAASGGDQITPTIKRIR